MRQNSPHSGLALIALYKLLKALLLLLAGAGFLRLADIEIDTFLSPLMEALQLSHHLRVIHALLLKVEVLQHQSVLMMGLVSLSYAALLFVEGFGLWMEVSWAAYMTVITTSLLLPGEFHAVTRDVSLTGLTVLVVNLIIVGYLVRQLGEQTLH